MITSRKPLSVSSTVLKQFTRDSESTDLFDELIPSPIDIPGLRNYWKRELVYERIRRCKYHPPGPWDFNPVFRRHFESNIRKNHAILFANGTKSQPRE